MASSNLPVPGESSTPLEKLQYEHAVLYESYQKLQQEVVSLESIIHKYQTAFGQIDSAMQGVLR